MTLALPDEVEAFVQHLHAIPWLKNVGDPVPHNADCIRLSGWEAWKGPEHWSVTEMCERGQSLNDDLLSQGGDEAHAVWHRIQRVVMDAAKAHVPFSDEQDVWYGPNMAVAAAAFTAGLVGLCALLGRKVPSEIQMQWKWLEAGHWVCDWHGEFPEGKPVVF